MSWLVIDRCWYRIGFTNQAEALTRKSSIVRDGEVRSALKADIEGAQANVRFGPIVLKNYGL